MNRCDCPNELEEEALRRAQPRERLLVELGMETGLRISELLSLTVRDVWDGQKPVAMVRLSRRHLKGGRGVRARPVRSRAIPLNAPAREAIAHSFAGERRQPQEPLFISRKSGCTHPMTRRHASRLIRHVFLAAGLPRHKVWAGHSLRRRFVRRIYEAHGINIARAAVGHRWINTTQIYLGLDEEEAQAAILSLGTTNAAPAANATVPRSA